MSETNGPSREAWACSCPTCSNIVANPGFEGWRVVRPRMIEISAKPWQARAMASASPAKVRVTRNCAAVCRVPERAYSEFDRAPQAHVHVRIATQHRRAQASLKYRGSGARGSRHGPLTQAPVSQQHIMSQSHHLTKRSHQVSTGIELDFGHETLAELTRVGATPPPSDERCHPSRADGHPLSATAAAKCLESGCRRGHAANLSDIPSIRFPLRRRLLTGSPAGPLTSQHASRSCCLNRASCRPASHLTGKPSGSGAGWSCS